MTSNKTVEQMDEEDGPPSPGPPPLQDQNGMEVTAPVQKSAKTLKTPEVTVTSLRFKERKRVGVTELNPHIQCALCKGYLIDPVTVVECLHSFCKSCIIKHVEGSKFCPTCDIQIHKTKPLLSLRADKALQDIVYKVVPGLYRTEMQNRLKFYNNHPEAEPANPEDGGEVADSLFFSPEDEISMSIEYFDTFSKTDEVNKNGEDVETENPNRRFLQCPGSVTVKHLKKFIITKYGLDQSFVVDVIYKEDLLPEDHTLIDVAYSYNWRKVSPMQFFYRIYQKTKVLTRKRKKKKTKTNSKSQPAKKRRNIDPTSTFNNVETRQENGMEIDDEDSKNSKVSSNLKGQIGDSNKNKINTSLKTKDKKDEASKRMPTLHAKSVKSDANDHSTSVSKAKSEKPLTSNKTPLSSQSQTKTVTFTQNPPKTVVTSPKQPETGVSTKNLIKPSVSAPEVSKTVISTEYQAKTSVSPQNSIKTVVSTQHQTKTVTFSKNLIVTCSQNPPITVMAPTTQSKAVLSSQNQAKPVVSTQGMIKMSIAPTKTTGVSDKKSAKSPPVVSRSTPTSVSAAATVSQNPIKPTPQPSKKSLTALLDNKTSVMQTKLLSHGKTVTNVADIKSPSLGKEAKEKVTAALSKQPIKDKAGTNGQKGGNVGKKAEPEVGARVKSVQMTASKPKKDTQKLLGSEKEVVEISVEVSASDVKKVLEKKKAEKDAKLMSNGEEKLYSNYSIVDQLKKGAAAANLAKQIKLASMMDFARTSEALNAPKVPPIIQGLQPKATPNSETNVLSAIVHSLAQKQQSLNQKIQAVTSNSESRPEDKSKILSTSASDSIVSKEKDGETESNPKPPELTKSLGTMLATGLGTKTPQEKPSSGKSGTSIAPKLPVSTSIKPISKEEQQSPTPVDTSGSKGQQMLNFYKNNFPKTTGEEAKSTETLTKNIPAGTTVTVKTVDNKQAKPAPSSSPTSKSSAFRMNLSNSNYSSPKQVPNPYSAVSQPSLINPFVHSPMSMALAAQQHAQYLNFSNQHIAAAAAISAQMEAVANANYINNTAANLVRAAAAAQITQSQNMTTLEFTKPVSSSALDESRFGLKIPQPAVSRQQSPSVSSFGTSRLQVKVNSDTPKTSAINSQDLKTLSSINAKLNSGETGVNYSSAKIACGTHSMPAMLPFHGVKKVQALPKTVNQSSRAISVPSLISNKNSSRKSPPLSSNSPSKSPDVSSKPAITPASSLKSLTEANPYKACAPVKNITSNFDNNVSKGCAPTPASIQNPFKPVTQVNSLKKLVADLNSVQQKNIKGDNLLNSLKKNSDNKILSDPKKSFGKEVTSS